MACVEWSIDIDLLFGHPPNLVLPQQHCGPSGGNLDVTLQVLGTSRTRRVEEEEENTGCKTQLDRERHWDGKASKWIFQVVCCFRWMRKIINVT